MQAVLDQVDALRLRELGRRQAGPGVWVCHGCSKALRAMKSADDTDCMPQLCIANGLELDPLPPELACLNAMEVRFISQVCVAVVHVTASYVYPWCFRYAR